MRKSALVALVAAGLLSTGAIADDTVVTNAQLDVAVAPVTAFAPFNKATFTKPGFLFGVGGVVGFTAITNGDPNGVNLIPPGPPNLPPHFGACHTPGC